MADYLQWEKARPDINPAFTDGAGPGPAAATNFLEDIIWEDTLDYDNEVAALVNWDIDGAEWTFDEFTGLWNVSGAQIGVTKLSRLATIEVQIGTLVRVTVVVDSISAGALDIRLDAQQIVVASVPGTFTGVVTAAGAAGFVIIEGSATAVAGISYVKLSIDKAFNTYRLANDSAITVT